LIRWCSSHKVESVTVLVVAFVLFAVSISTREDFSAADKQTFIGPQESASALEATHSLPAGETGQMKPGAGNDATQKKNQADGEYRAEATDDPGQVDAYIAAEAGSRINGFKPLQATGGTRWKGESKLPDARDKESEDDEQSSYDEDRAEDEEPYPRNEIIAGRVLSESGMPLIGVGVTATALNFFDVPPTVTVAPVDLQRYAVTDTAGYYRFEQLVAGDYRINSVPTESYGMSQISVRSGVDFADIVVKTQRQLSVVGRVTDTNGKPLPHALVQPQALGESGAYSDSAGNFQLHLRIPEQAKTLGIRTELYGYRGDRTMLSTDQSLGDQSATLMIELEPLVIHTVVTGVLRSAEDGSPVAQKTVQLYSAQKKQRYSATSKDDGRFTMMAVEAGDQYELLVAGGGGYAAYVQPNIAVDENILELDLRLEADQNRALSGQMVNLHGMPIANFSLVARAANPPYQWVRVTSDARGHFVMQNPPQGPLVFESQSMPHIKISGVQASATNGQMVSLTVDIGRDEIYGNIVDANGQPVAVPNVVASWQHAHNGINSSSTRRTAADSQGGFVFRDLGPGERTIVIDARGYKTARVKHDAAIDGYQFTVQLEADSTG
jgi:protocatechuate 3,4-dioxygenase beta subunit